MMGLLTSQLRHHSSAVTPAMFGQYQLKLLLGHNGFAFISLDATHTTIDVVMCGSSQLVASRWAGVFQAVQDVVATQRSESERASLAVQELCSECWRRCMHFPVSTGQLLYFVVVF